MKNIKIRGNCDGMPLEMTGEFTGYNNGATMQVGLWIRNDGQHIDSARVVATERGPRALARLLTGIMSSASYTSAAHGAWDAAIASGGGIPCVDWAQIAYDLIGDEPDEDDLRVARELLMGTNGVPTVTEDEIWKLASRMRTNRARLQALSDR